MRKILALTVVLLLVPSMVSAQRGGGERGGRGMAMMRQNVAQLLIQQKDTLALTAEQVTKLEALSTQLDQKTDTLRQELEAARGAGRDASPEQRQAMMQKMQQLQAVYTEFFDAEIKPVLTPEQATQATALIAASRPGRGRRGGGARRGGGGGTG